MRGENSKAELNVSPQYKGKAEAPANVAMDAEPLIYTTLGNMPIKDLEHYVQWDNNPGEIIFTEVYKLEGVEVKRSVHIWKKKGQAIEGKQAKMG